MGYCVNIMGSCVSFQIKVQILAFYTDVCMAPKRVFDSFYRFLAEVSEEIFVLYPKAVKNSGIPA